MREILTEERKKISLEILIQIDLVCKKYNLSYFLAYGSLIGAVRHGGFIPWDDDIDIWMPYEDYKKFETIAADLEEFYLLKAFGNSEWNRPFAKLCKSNTLIVDSESASPIKRGIAVDVFPLFTCGKKDLDKLVSYQKMITRTFLYENGYVKNKLKRTVYKGLSIFGKDSYYYSKKFLKLTDKKSGNSYFSASPYMEKDLHSKILFESIQMDFEGFKFSVPKGFDLILSKIYGNYMELPPEEERKSNHNVKAYWINENN